MREMSLNRIAARQKWVAEKNGGRTSDDIVLGTLRELCASTPPMSATGGWYTIGVVQRHCGLDKTTVARVLYEAANVGVIERLENGASNLYRMEVRS